MSLARGYAAHSHTAPLVPYEFERRAVGPDDVRIEILYSGICHSDLHQARDDWGGSIYPMVPGHEIIGRVTEVGSNVTRFKVGDHAGVGCMVDSCRHCDACQHDRSSTAPRARPGPTTAVNAKAAHRPTAAIPTTWWSSSASW